MFRKHWQSLVKPTKLVLQTDHNKTTVTVEPLERGFGLTLGYALRRVMLSSLAGAAVTTVHIQGTPRVFASADDRRRAFEDLILNIKEIVIRMNAAQAPATMVIHKRGPALVLAGDAQRTDGVEIVNPEHHICVVNPGCEIRFDLTVGYGKGYEPATSVIPEDWPDALHARLDALYSPVRRASIVVETARLGRSLDYDRLILTVETDGTITGKDAISTAAGILREQFAAFINFEEPRPRPSPAQGNEPRFDPLWIRIDRLELSVRAFKCMKHANVVYLGDLVVMSEEELLRVPNFGRKSLNEIKAMLANFGLRLGMELPEWPPADAAEVRASENASCVTGALRVDKCL